MVTSMTGYGRSQQSIDGRDITVEIKSVNHRYFEFSARVPRAFGYLEEKLKGYLQGKISRGKVEAGVTVVDTGAAHTAVDINHELAASYINAMRVTGEKLSLQDDLTVSSLMRFSDLFSVHRVQEDEETIWTEVRLVADGAIERFIAMRATEGERLKADILERLESIESRVAAVAEQSPRTEAAYRERLTAKIREVLEDRQIDETRIVTEAAHNSCRQRRTDSFDRTGTEIPLQCNRILWNFRLIGFNAELLSIGSMFNIISGSLYQLALPDHRKRADACQLAPLHAQIQDGISVLLISENNVFYVAFYFFFFTHLLSKLAFKFIHHFAVLAGSKRNDARRIKSEAKRS